MRPLRQGRFVPPTLYDRLCNLWSGGYQPEMLREKQQQWVMLWRDLIPVTARRFPEVHLEAEEPALGPALSRD